MTPHHNVNGRPSILAAIALGTVGVFSFIVQPGLVQGFVSELGLNEIEANTLAFSEMLGVAIATVLMAFLTRLANWRYLLIVSIALASVGNLASGLIGGGDLIKPLRFITGLGEGGIIGLSFTYIGLTAKPERNLALYLVSLLTYGALGLWLMPNAFATIGLSGIFMAWGVLTAVSIFLVKFTPSSSDNRVDISPTAAQLNLSFLAFALLGVLLYNIAIGVAWANLFLIGMEIRPDEQSIANALLIAQFVAIPGALLAALMSDKLGRWLPIIIGIFGGAAFMALLMFKSDYSFFIISVCGFNFMWNMVLPFILAAVNDMDEKSRMVTPAISMQMIGLGFGPFFAALLLGEGGGFRAIEGMTVKLLILSFIILAICIFAHQKALKSKKAQA